MKLALEEQERWFYANGQVEEAKIIAIAVDMQEELCDTLNQADDLRRDYDQLEELYDELKEKS